MVKYRSTCGEAEHGAQGAVEEAEALRGYVAEHGHAHDRVCRHAFGFELVISLVDVFGDGDGRLLGL